VDLERGPLSLVSTTEENMAVGIFLSDHVAPSIRKKLTITSPTSGGRSVGIVRSRTQTMEISFFLSADFFFNCWYLEIPSDNRIRHIPRCVQYHAQGFGLERLQLRVTLK
jgi:hypothetical protein